MFSLGGFSLKSKIKSFFLATFAIFMATSLIAFPTQTLEASLRGIDMWWGTVFPSLLPFFITAELLIGFGVVRFIGVLFEPIMRPLFNVPGVGSFVWAMGMASGYPSGAKLTARLRQEKQLTRIEAERLVSFTNASNPLFIIAAVSVGFFHDPSLGFLLAITHYSSNILVGISMRFYRKNGDKSKSRSKPKWSLNQAFEALHKTRIEDNRPFGKLFGDAVIQSVQTLLMIGGFIIIFSVFSTLLLEVGVASLVSTVISFLFRAFSLPEELALPFFSGIFEITVGAQLIANSGVNSILPQAIIVSILLAFNGFSVQAQVASILAETDIRFFPYFFARLLQGAFAAGIVTLLYPILYMDSQETIIGNTPVFSHANEHLLTDILIKLQEIGPILTLVTLMIACLLLIKNIRQNH